MNEDKRELSRRLGDDKLNLSKKSKLDNYSPPDPGEVTPPAIKGRNPVTASAKLFLKSAGVYMAKSAGATMLSVLKSYFPYTTIAAGELTKAVDEVKEMHREAMKKMHPELMSLKRSTRRLLPKTDRYLPPKLRQKLKDATEGWDDPDKLRDRARTQSDEDIRDATITGAVESIVAQQNILTKTYADENRTDKQMDRVISSIRYTKMQKSITSIDHSLFSVDSFNRKVHMEFLKKGLELKYKHLFVAQDTFSVLERGMQQFEKQLEEIKHNVSIPDYMKQRGIEKHVKERWVGYGEQIGKWWWSVRKNIAQKLFDTAVTSVKTASQGLETAADMSQLTDDMAEFETGEEKLSDKQKNVKTAGTLTGKLMGWLAASKFGNKALSRVGRAARGFDSNFENIKERSVLGVEAYKREAKESDDPTKRMLGSLLDSLTPGLGTSASKFVEDTTSGTAAMAWDKASRTSLVEIIPGYLAKILKTNQDAADGGDHEELIWDPTKFKFVGQKQYHTSMVEKAIGSQETRLSRVAEAAGGLKRGAVLGGVEPTTFDALSDEVTRVLLNHGQAGMGLSPKDMHAIAYGRTQDVNRKYRSTVFKGVDEAVIQDVAGLFTLSLFDENQHVRQEVKQLMDRYIVRSLKDDQYKSVFGELFSSYGRRGMFSDLFDESGQLKTEEVTKKHMDVLESDKGKEQYSERLQQGYDRYDRALRAIAREKERNQSDESFSGKVSQILEKTLGIAGGAVGRTKEFVGGKVPTDVDYDELKERLINYGKKARTTGGRIVEEGSAMADRIKKSDRFGRLRTTGKQAVGAAWDVTQGVGETVKGAYGKTREAVAEGGAIRGAAKRATSAVGDAVSGAYGKIKGGTVGDDTIAEKYETEAGTIYVTGRAAKQQSTEPSLKTIFTEKMNTLIDAFKNRESKDKEVEPSDFWKSFIQRKHEDDAIIIALLARTSGEGEYETPGRDILGKIGGGIKGAGRGVGKIVGSHRLKSIFKSLSKASTGGIRNVGKGSISMMNTLIKYGALGTGIAGSGAGIGAGLVGRGLTGAFKQGLKTVQGVGKFMERGGGKAKFVDIYRKGEIDPGNPLLSAAKQREGVILANSGKRLRSSEDVDQPIIDPSMDPPEVIVSADDIEHGLVDIYGNTMTEYGQPKTKGEGGTWSSIRKLFGKSADTMEGVFGLAKGLGKAGKEMIGGLWAKLVNNKTPMDDPQLLTLIRIEKILKDRLPKPHREGSMAETMEDYEQGGEYAQSGTTRFYGGGKKVKGLLTGAINATASKDIDASEAGGLMQEIMGEVGGRGVAGGISHVFSKKAIKKITTSKLFTAAGPAVLATLPLIVIAGTAYAAYRGISGALNKWSNALDEQAKTQQAAAKVQMSLLKSISDKRRTAVEGLAATGIDNVYDEMKNIASGAKSLSDYSPEQQAMLKTAMKAEKAKTKAKIDLTVQTNTQGLKGQKLIDQAIKVGKRSGYSPKEVRSMIEDEARKILQSENPKQWETLTEQGRYNLITSVIFKNPTFAHTVIRRMLEKQETDRRMKRYGYDPTRVTETGESVQLIKGLGNKAGDLIGQLNPFKSNNTTADRAIDRSMQKSRTAESADIVRQSQLDQKKNKSNGNLEETFGTMNASLSMVSQGFLLLVDHMKNVDGNTSQLGDLKEVMSKIAENSKAVTINQANIGDSNRKTVRPPTSSIDVAKEEVAI